MVWSGMVLCSMVLYGMVLYSMVLYGMVWYGMVRNYTIQRFIVIGVKVNTEALKRTSSVCFVFVCKVVSGILLWCCFVCVVFLCVHVCFGLS